MEELIKLDNISFSYDNKNILLQNVNFNIYRSDFIGLVGVNGSGKSTLLKLITGVIKPTSGSIICNKKIKFGYVNQTTSLEEGAFPATVYEIVSLGICKKPFRFINKEDKNKIEQVLELFGLSKLKDKSINSLSGGQMQKVKIAKVLLSNPDLIILDEPTTGIDTISQEVLLELIRHLHAMKKTILFVSHNVKELEGCTRVVEISDNGIVEVNK
ncbi:MAG: ATP-binding cassette domain-containing protein [Acholeplasmatales bacterium]|nr:ATP-binding cassette domain-containing protein [Acholeplasmatales bacterium]